MEREIERDREFEEYESQSEQELEIETVQKGEEDFLHNYAHNELCESEENEHERERRERIIEERPEQHQCKSCETSQIAIEKSIIMLTNVVKDLQSIYKEESQLGVIF